MNAEKDPAQVNRMALILACAYLEGRFLGENPGATESPQLSDFLVSEAKPLIEDFRPAAIEALKGLRVKK